jgi:hypothetical protein
MCTQNNKDANTSLLKKQSSANVLNKIGHFAVGMKAFQEFPAKLSGSIIGSYD